jgi:hypothetical protein
MNGVDALARALHVVVFRRLSFGAVNFPYTAQIRPTKQAKELTVESRGLARVTYSFFDSRFSSSFQSKRSRNSIETDTISAFQLSITYPITIHSR